MALPRHAVFLQWRKTHAGAAAAISPGRVEASNAVGICGRRQIGASALSTLSVARNVAPSEKATRKLLALHKRLKANLRRDRDFPSIDMQRRAEFFGKSERYRAAKMRLGSTLFPL